MNRSNWMAYTLVVLFCGGGIYWMRNIQKMQRQLYEEVRSSQLFHSSSNSQELGTKRDAGEPHIPGQAWSELQDKVKNAVVQVFSQVGTIDLLQPYKTPNQYQGTGSGFFINKEGEIITNAHVIDQAKAVWIQIPGLGKQQIDVEIVGLSPERDLALLRVPAEGLEIIKTVLGEIPHLGFGDSNDVKRADEVMTLGYPLGQQGLKSTVGVVSGREQHLIQIDAPINPGNSGGPSLNRSCQVVGVNTLYAPDAQNVGFIIPINQLKIVLDDLRTVKLLRKPFLGIIFNNGSESLTNYLSNPQPGGLYVVDVYKGSPLAKAGVKRGDMIYEINGYKLDMYGEMFWQGEKVALIDYVSQMKLGQQVDLVVYRKGARKDISLTFEQTELLPIRHVYPGFEKLDYEVTAGMVVQPLTINHLPILVNQAPALAKYAEMKYQMEPALIITHIFPDSQAHRSRSLMPGSILKEVNGEPCKTMQEFRAALSKGMTTGNLTIETNEGVFVVCPFKKVLEEQVRLAKDYFFPLSDTTKTLLVQAEKQSWFKIQKDEFLFAQVPGLIPVGNQAALAV
ncbi:MAG TPA: trypsin-like peptidase domain-containing protein [Candidatus Babeliales bacterium]|nr:trypsin-like peptidase domain-containing protein [Candidatus Babeliales bacterium]